MNLYYETYDSPIGEICIVTTQNAVTDIMLFKDEWQTYLANNPDIERGSLLAQRGIEQLQEYFSGSRKRFDLPLLLTGTPYRMQVWEQVELIPYGDVTTYQEIANRIGNPKSVRAIGQANKVNRVPIVIPCHRVIGKNGKMTGYAGDRINIKEYLLELENTFNEKKL